MPASIFNLDEDSVDVTKYKSDVGDSLKDNTTARIVPIRTSFSEEDVRHNVFADPDIAAHYALAYEKAQYECRHAFDPHIQWSKEEERKIVRKLDWHVCLWAVSEATLLQASHLVRLAC